MNASVLFDTPQREIASQINAKLDQCQLARIVSGFIVPSGVRALAGPIRARPQIIKNLVLGAATYPGFEALDELLRMGVAPDAMRIHLGHTRESGTRKHPFVRHHPMLHSKIFYMELSEGQACAFIGSNNVTSFALHGLNGEAAVLLEGPIDSDQFARIRNHIQIAANQAVPYWPHMKEAYAFWVWEFFSGLRTEINIPEDWTTIRTILTFAEANPSLRPNTGEPLYFELPAGIAIDSLKTEAHLFLFTTLPPSPEEALQQLPNARARFLCKVLGAENRQGNLEVVANWRIERTPRPSLLPVQNAVFRPQTAKDMQQVRAEIVAPSVTPYEYLFERERIDWWPIFSEKEAVRPQGGSREPFPVRDTPWAKESDAPWKLVTGLKHAEGTALEKDAAALALAKPESGSFILVSLRRRIKKHNASE